MYKKSKELGFYFLTSGILALITIGFMPRRVLVLSSSVYLDYHYRPYFYFHEDAMPIILLNMLLNVVNFYFIKKLEKKKHKKLAHLVMVMNVFIIIAIANIPGLDKNFEIALAIMVLLQGSIAGTIYYFTGNEEEENLKNLKNINVNSNLFGGGDGSTEQSAVIIKATNSLVGIPAEYEYVQALYGKKGQDWELILQMQHYNNLKNYDILKIKLSNGSEKTIYFDITNFFGKF